LIFNDPSNGGQTQAATPVTALGLESAGVSTGLDEATAAWSV